MDGTLSSTAVCGPAGKGGDDAPPVVIAMPTSQPSDAEAASHVKISSTSRCVPADGLAGSGRSKNAPGAACGGGWAGEDARAAAGPLLPPPPPPITAPLPAAPLTSRTRPDANTGCCGERREASSATGDSVTCRPSAVSPSWRGRVSAPCHPRADVASVLGKAQRA